MEKPKILLALFLFLSLFFNTSFLIDDNLEANKRAFDDIKSKYSNCNDSVCQTKYQGELKDLFKEVRGTDVLSKYLKFQIRTEMSVASYAIEIEEKSGKLNKLFSSSKELRRRLKPFLNQKKICDDLNHTDINQLNWFQLGNDDKCDLIKDEVQKGKRILKKMEEYIFLEKTRNKTFKEINDYFKFATYPSLEMDSDFAYQAFKEYYKIYTLDGDNRSINSFESEPWGTEGLRHRLRIKLREDGIIKKDLSLAREGKDLLLDYSTQNKLNISNIKEYRDYIKRAGPNEQAFLLLKRIVSNFVDKRDYNSSSSELKRWEGIFCPEGNLYDEICSDYKGYTKLITSPASSSRENLALMEGDFKDQINEDHIRFIFSENLQYMGIIPHEEEKPISIYQKNKDGKESWSELNTFNKPDKPSNYTFQFELEPNVNKPEKKIVSFDKSGKMLLQSRGIYSDSEKNFHTDFFIYNADKDPSNWIAFFVSSSNYLRKEQTASSTSEFNSPWKTYNKLEFQEYGNEKFFHGKKSGNNNTDIYYSFYSPTKKGWLPAKHLGNIINSRYSERSPFLKEDVLYFSSEGHGGLGGYDVFSISVEIDINKKEIRTEGVLENEVGLNSIDDELYYYNFDKDQQYLSSNREDQRFQLFKITKVNDRPRIKVVGNKELSESDLGKIITIKIQYDESIDKRRIIPIKIFEENIDNAAQINTDYEIIGINENNKIIIEPGTKSKSIQLKTKKDNIKEETESIMLQVGEEVPFKFKIINNVVNVNKLKPTSTKAVSYRPAAFVDCDRYDPGTINGDPESVDVTLRAFTVSANNDTLPFVGGEVKVNYQIMDRGRWKKHVSDKDLITDEKGRCPFSVPLNAKLQVLISKEDENGDLTHFNCIVKDGCRVDMGNKIVKETIEAEVTEFKKIQKINIPIFFEFNRKDILNDINNLEEVTDAYDIIFEKFRGKSIEFVVVAYADRIGLKDRNCNLSRERSEEVRNMLIKTWGVDKDKISHLGLGSTIDFDYEITKVKQKNNGRFNPSFNVKYVFPEKHKLTGPDGKTEDELIKLQLNRRAEIILCHERKIDNCLQQYKISTDGCPN